MKRQTLVLGFAALAVLVWSGAGCESPVPADGHYGWVVGDAANGYGTILQTSDHGTTWQRQGDSATIPDVNLSGVSAADNRNVWVVGGSAPVDGGPGFGTILHTSDGGETWIRQGSAASVPDAELMSVSAVNTQVAWAVGAQGTILKTTNRGATWVSKADTAFPRGFFGEVSAWNEDIVWVVGNTDWSTSPSLVIHTTDGGASWTRQGADSLATVTGLIDVHAASANVAWTVGTDYAGFRTTDAGAHWYRTLPEATPHVNGVCALDEQAAWLAVDYSAALFTPNGGDTWVKQNTPGEGSFPVNLGVTAVHPDTVWMTSSTVAGPGLILRTFDGGENWTVQLRSDNAGLGNIGFQGISFAGAAR